MGWLWVLSEKGGGIPYRIPDYSKPESLSDLSWTAERVKFDEDYLQIRQIASCSKSAFALDTNGVIHVFLHPAVLLVRKSFEFFENQRWYPVLGWSHPLPTTDWPRISDKEGHTASFDSEALTSEGWRWEESREVQKSADCDKDGWQYNQKFSKVTRWSKKGGITSFVRRRRWKRSMRYIAVGKWIPIPYSGQNFVSISAGCSSVTNGGCLLFGIGTDGKIYKRTVTSTMPEGDQWSCIEGISNQEDVVLLSCAPVNPFVLAVTWEGKLYGRTGITSKCFVGTSWQQLQTPSGKPVTSVSIGNESMWITTADGQLYWHHLDVVAAKNSRNFLYFHEETYRNVGSGWSCPTVTADDDLFVIKNGKAFLRDGISFEERTGKAFVPLVERAGEDLKLISIATGGIEQDRKPNHWINENIFLNNNTGFLCHQTKWRKEILTSMIAQNEHYWDIFQLHSTDLSLTLAGADSGYSKYSKVRIQFSPNINYFDGYMSICLPEQKIVASTGRKSVEESFDKLLQAERVVDICPFKYCLALMFEKDTDIYHLRIAFPSEKDRDNWHEQLQMIIIRSHVSTPREGNQHACWTIGKGGNVRQHPMNELVLDDKQNPTLRKLSQLRSIDIPGHFKNISAGTDNVVWTINEMGQPYVLCPSWTATNERNLYSYEQFDTVLKTVYEYQRHQFLRGYMSFASEIQGIGAWMGEDGPCGTNYNKLPSSEWSWLDENWTIENTHKDEGWSYSHTIKGNFTSDKQLRFRRRKLFRRARYQAMTPWIAVEAPGLKAIVVQRDPGDRILVFGLTEMGDVLLRQGVEKSKPQGCVWKQIITDAPISSLAIRSPTEIWAVTMNGKIWIRECEEQTDMECCDWREGPWKLPEQASSMVVQKRGWFIVKNTLIMLDIQPTEDDFTFLSSEEIHHLCHLEPPNSLSLMSQGFLAVLEEGQINHHMAWEKKISKQGRRSEKSYQCTKMTLSTSYTKNCSFN